MIIKIPLQTPQAPLLLSRLAFDHQNPPIEQPLPQTNLVCMEKLNDGLPKVF